MSERPVCELDLSASDFVADPYPDLARMRCRMPIGWHEGTGRWLVLSHEACSAVLRDRRLGRIWHDRQPTGRFEPFNLLHRNQMMEHEPPEHSRLRRKVSAAFARGHVERMRPRVTALGERLLRQVGGGDFDVLKDYAEPMPVLVIAELLGVPSADFATLRAWSQAIVRMYEPMVTTAVEDAALQASREFADYLRGLVVARRSDLGEDLLSDLLRSQAGADGLTDDEVVASSILLLNAGHEASVNVFGNGLVAMLRSTEQWDRLVGGEVALELAVEEMLRFDSALQLFERTATADVEVGDVLVRTGEKVAVLLGSANRDETVFADADVFDVGRDPNPHLAFGAGVHFCLGGPLARMELAESLRLLVARFPSMSLAREPERRQTFVLRGYHSVPVNAEASSRDASYG